MEILFVYIARFIFNLFVKLALGALVIGIIIGALIFQMAA